MKSAYHCVVVVLGACITISAQQSTAVRAPDGALERRVDALFNRVVRPDGPGCAVGVYQNGRAVLTRGYGLASIEDGRPITARTAFNLGSFSKPFTALAVLMLEQRGQLSLDDDVRRWVPELPTYGAPIRVRDLLQHTSGLRDFQALETLSARTVSTRSELMGLLAAQRALNFAPGSRHEYSHSDYVLLGLVVERVVGAPFGEHLERELLAPLGMKGSFVHDGRVRSTKDRAFGHVVSQTSTRVQFPNSQIVGGDGLYASVEDLAYWDRNFDNASVGGTAMARMQERPKLVSGETIPYAFGLRLGSYRGLRTVSRGGFDKGTRTEMIRYPDHSFAIATLCNTDRVEPWRLGQAVADLYLGAFMTPARKPVVPTVVKETAEALAPLTGVYRSVEEPWNLMRVDVRNGVLGYVLFDPLEDEYFQNLASSGGGRFFEVGTTGNIGLYNFRTVASGVPPRLDITWSGAMGDFSQSLERISDSAVWRPSAAAVADYAGTWFSQELDAGWQLEQRGEKLLLRRRGQLDLTLWPVERDYFVRGFGAELIGELRFQRDGAGTLTHFTVSTPPGEESARDVRFIRVPPR